MPKCSWCKKRVAVAIIAEKGKLVGSPWSSMCFMCLRKILANPDLYEKSVDSTLENEIRELIDSID